MDALYMNVFSTCGNLMKRQSVGILRCFTSGEKCWSDYSTQRLPQDLEAHRRQADVSGWDGRLGAGSENDNNDPR